MLYSQELEKLVLAGMLKYPDSFIEISSFIDEDDFAHEINRVVFSVIRGCVYNSESVNKVIIAQKIKNLGVSFKDSISPFDYLDALSMMPVSPSSMKDATKSLKVFTRRRQFVDVADKIKKKMIKSGDMDYDQIINWVDKEFYDKMNTFYQADDTIDLFETMYERAEDLALNPREELGFATPYQTFNEMYGGFQVGEVYVFCSRPKQGKALASDTLIPTPLGFVKIEDLKVGDEVFAVDGTPTKVTNVARWSNRKVYTVKDSRGHEVTADGEHDWIVKTAKTSQWKKMSTKEMLMSQRRRGDGFILPRTGSLLLKKKTGLVDPYLVGVKISGGIKFEVFSITSKHKTAARLLKKQSVAKLKKLYHMEELRIPKDYLWSSERHRLSLLRGIVDSNGKVSVTGETTIRYKDGNFKKDICQLLASLAIPYKVISATTKRVGKIIFNHAKPSRHSKKIAYAKESASTRTRRVQVFDRKERADTVCIEIEHPSHVFLCGESMMPTHNSTFLNSTAIRMANELHGLPCLILDTEMQQDMIGDRVLASMTGIPLWYLRTGNWAKYPDYRESYEMERERQRNNRYSIHHKYVMNMPLDQVIQTIKKWYYTKVGRGNPCLIVYDYIKLTGESLSDHNKEYQVIGEKINRLKELVGKEVNAPLITAMQLNRSGENSRGGQSDDSTAISLSDRALWFASYVGIFRRKTFDEMAEYGSDFGSHSLIHLESRWQGRSSKGHMDYVKTDKGKFVKNFTNFHVENFSVQERDSAEGMFKKLSFTPNESTVQSPL